MTIEEQIAEIVEGTERLRKATKILETIVESRKARAEQIKMITGEDGMPQISGWVCPVCGRGLSPYTQSCPCKGMPKYEVTC